MADIMNRGDVLNTVAAECEMSSAKVDSVLKAFEGAIARTLSQGGEVRIAGFGTFKTSHRAARTSRNPRTGDPVEVPARTAARFVPGKGLKTAAESGGGGKPSETTAAAKGETKVVKAAKAASTDAPAKKAAKTEKAPAKKKK